MSHHEPFRLGRTALFLALTIAVICGAIAAGAVWNAGVRADRALGAHRHQVSATTTGRSKDPQIAVRFGPEPRAIAPAVWNYPAGVRRSGTVPVPPETPQGHTVTITVDDTGSPARPPGSAADRALTSLAGGTVTAGTVVAAEAATFFLVRRRSQTRRLAAWEREWEQVEPVWSGRLRRGGGRGSGDG
ncbi:hypothetical protein ACN9M0_31350 [Streptomyces sp. R-07]|uniref:Rv1733c family protein n=1 Tax=unclassified Streptomyces TaxID=2593676 RepID=UPI00344416E3